MSCIDDCELLLRNYGLAWCRRRLLRHLGVYTAEALSFVKGLNLELIDGAGLRRMIDMARKQPAVKAVPRRDSASPTCPKCSMRMVKRIARQGAQAGKEFWGCVGYPACIGTRFIDSGVSPGPGTDKPPAEEAVIFPATKKCPNCSAEMALRQFPTGPKSGQYFYGCVHCKKGYPAE